MTGYSYCTPIWASRPAAIDASTGLTEEACTRTSTSLSAGVGSGRSSRKAGWVSGASRVMARMSISWVAGSCRPDDNLPYSTIISGTLYGPARLEGPTMTPARTDQTTTDPASILDEHRSRPGLLLALLGQEAMRRLRAAHLAHNLKP